MSEGNSSDQYDDEFDCSDHDDDDACDEGESLVHEDPTRESTPESEHDYLGGGLMGRVRFFLSTCTRHDPWLCQCSPVAPATFSLLAIALRSQLSQRASAEDDTADAFIDLVREFVKAACGATKALQSGHAGPNSSYFSSVVRTWDDITNHCNLITRPPPTLRPSRIRRKRFRDSARD